MAIAVDATASNWGTGATVTFAHTCAAGAKLFVLVAGSGALDVSGVTYNGVAMTRVLFHDGATSGRRTSVYYLANPDSGSHNVVVSTDSNSAYCASISFTGADTYDATNTKEGTTSPESITLNTNNAGNGYIVSCLNIDGTPATDITYGGSGAEWGKNGDGNGEASFTYTAYTSGGNGSESWTTGSNVGYGAISIEIKELAASLLKPLIISQAVKRAATY